MIVKLIGALILVLSGAMLGYDFSKRLTMRANVLSEFLNSLLYIENSMSYICMPLAEIFSSLSNTARGETGCFFEYMANDLKNIGNQSVGEIWDSNMTRCNFSLNKEDYIPLKDFAMGLGSTGMEEQLKNIALCRIRLENCLADAKEDIKKYSKMYRGLGFFGGLLVAIILF